MSAIGGPTHPIGDPQRIFELIKSCKEEGFQNKEDGKRAAAMALAARWASPSRWRGRWWSTART